MSLFRRPHAYTFEAPRNDVAPCRDVPLARLREITGKDIVTFETTIHLDLGSLSSTGDAGLLLGRTGTDGY